MNEGILAAQNIIDRLDDAQVAAIVSTKRYESANQAIGAVIRLEAL
jgi:hypothetical protein